MEQAGIDHGGAVLNSHDTNLLDPAAMLLRSRRARAAPHGVPTDRLTDASNPAGGVDLVDAPGGDIRHVRIPEGVDVYPWPTADESGWCAGASSRALRRRRGRGVLGLDGVVCEGPLPPLHCRRSATVAVARFDVDDATPHLLRFDTATGAVEEIPDRPGSAPGAIVGLSFAGWASVGDR